jgi:lipoate-protein ligase A
VGALPRPGVLNHRRPAEVSERPLFDAAAIRTLGRRTAFVRRVERPTLVLGSTQDASVVDSRAMARRGVELARRRSGGGAVLVEPGRAVWIDTWVPRTDPLWSDDVAESRAWVGSWWAESLGVADLEVHRGRPVSSRWSDLICFAGVGAGEVLYRGRKAVGVAQWRGREGVLTHSLAYVAVDWADVTALLELGPGRADAAGELAAAAITLGELVPTDPDRLVSTLIERLPDPGSWEAETSA